ncbi:NAD-dependent deacetylase [Sorangium cellulosum]|uniref:NAD-dependent protein deacetylase n=1 Tax=Sorangium cellulosum TaxID=56 RepID=A0A2L0EVC8_SORCE|nr:NAD-dependent protein deacetylase [Sorangium cellulosum]AUX43225.1 NAD-dependent deacetylase [Sorangium cellulosum]
MSPGAALSLEPLDPEPLDALVALVRGKRLVVLTGAGCSTESGIPDYRGPETRRRARNPIQGREFSRSAEIRQRYWARAVIGWERFSRAEPNPAHHALARLERGGLLEGLITQNVDGLHHAAGSRRVIELHGALSEVACLACGAVEPRAALQERLLALNPGWLRLAADLAPDGDADLPAEHVARFQAPACLRCDGPLKPRVVFFGENVPRPIVDDAFALVDAADVLLVVGSSLAVFSGYRFVLRAAQRGIPIAMINLGSARGEELGTVKIEARAGEVLPRLAEALCAGALR